jgi:hypothetical protein
MAADNELPVWTIRPNWRNGVLERLEWLTDVLGSTYGTEQRRALRLSPRRTFEMTFNPFNEARSYFDLWLHRMGSEEFMVPLFHDRGKLTAAVTAGQDAIPVDTTYREFIAGGMAVIIGDDPFTFDVLEITAVANDELTIEAAGLAHGWPAGTAIHPLRRTRISQESLFAAITSRVGEAVLQFDLNQANDIAAEGAWALSYLGIPIILDEPNRRERIDFTYIRNSLIMDNETGLRHLLDDAGRAFTLQTYLKMMRGRIEHWEFRQLLYRLRGQQSPLWLPTFNRDFELSRSRLAGDAYLDIKKIGYAYTGGLIDGREHILINGSPAIAGVISGVGAAPTTAEERLTLSGALGQAMAAGVTGSFLDIVRLSQDVVEINHHTDTDGVAECNLAFRAFRDERTPPGVTFYPIPEQEFRNAPCGEVETFMLINPDFEFGNATGWNGTLNIMSSGNTSGDDTPPQGAFYARGGQSSVGYMYQTLDFPSWFHEDIDAGNLEISGFSALHSTYDDQTDHGRLFMEFQNGAGAVISTVYTPHDYSHEATRITIAATMVPPLARKVRLGAHSVRDEGSNNDNYWDDFTTPTLTVIP